MRRLLPLLSALALAGCPCPSFEGLDGNLTFRSCDGLDRPLLEESSFSLDDIAEGTTFVSSDESVLTVTGDGAVETFAPGAVEVAVTTPEGVTDRIAWEVVVADHALLVDEWQETAVQLLADGDPLAAGAAPDVQPTTPLWVWEGGEPALALSVRDDQGRDVAYAPSSIAVTGAVFESDVLVADGDADAILAQDGPTTLMDLPIERVGSLSSGSLDLAVYHFERPAADEWDPGEPDENDGTVIAYLKATVLDGDGRPVYQAPIEWSTLGPGQVETVFSDAPRTDIVMHRLTGADLDRVPTARVCVSAQLDTEGGTLVRSAWFAPDDFAVYEDANCGGRAACACSAGADETGGAWALVAAAMLLRRRRRGAARPCSAPGSRRGA